jgi:hypothetical protein
MNMGKIFNNNNKNIQKLVHSQFRVITKRKIFNKLQKLYNNNSPNRIPKQSFLNYKLKTSMKNLINNKSKRKQVNRQD